MSHYLINWFAVERRCGKLGKVQKRVLTDLAHFGRWSNSCGWMWTTKSRTEQIMNTLVARGAARRNEAGEYTPTPDILEVS